MIDLKGPVPPNHAWHDELFRGWRRDYPDPMPSPAAAPPPGDGLLFRPGPLYPEDEEARAPLLPGAGESGGGSGAYDDIAQARALDPENPPVTAFGNWRGPVTGLDWMRLTPLGLGSRVALGFLGALTGKTLPGSPQATQRAWDLRALQADIDDILAGAVAKGRWAGSAPLDPHKAGVSLHDNPFDISRFAGAGAGPDAGGFGSGFDPGTGMGPGPQGEPW